MVSRLQGASEVEMEDQVGRAGGLDDVSLFGKVDHGCGRLDGKRMVSGDVGRGRDVRGYVRSDGRVVPEAAAL